MEAGTDIGSKSGSMACSGNGRWFSLTKCRATAAWRGSGGEAEYETRTSGYCQSEKVFLALLRS